MGRKIPGKKHRGVKDPLEQLARRNESLKSLLNAPPVDPDYQEIPKSLLELNRLRKMAKDGIFKKRKRKKNKLIDAQRLAGYDPKLPGMIKQDKQLPKLVQRHGESDESFMQRLNDATDDIINEVKFEESHNVTVKRNKLGKVEDVVKDEDPFSDEELKTKFKKQNKRGHKKVKKKLTSQSSGEVKVDKGLNRRQKQKLKKAAKLEARKEEFGFKAKHDIIKFGEVAQQPPQLTRRPRGTGNFISKPGSKNLLLKSMLGESAGSKQSKASGLSMAAKRNLEHQRIEAVAAYRALKAKRALDAKKLIQKSD